MSGDAPAPAPEKPAVDAPLWDNIPAALAQRQQWVLWKFEWDAKRSAWLKVPYYAGGGRRTGDQGSEKDRLRLANLANVRAAFERKAGSAEAFTGVGFGFLPSDGLIGIDLDDHVDRETGQLSERAQRIVTAFNSYAEISPSGTGLHVYVLGHTHTAKSNDIGVEMFCEKQYFTVTGRHVPGTPLDVTQAEDAAVRRMHATIQEAKDRLKAPAPAPASSAQRKPAERGGRDDFRYVNDEALRALHVWVPALFGGREKRSGLGYRIESKDLGRDLQEAISIKPEGIVDWGVADMGDPREGKRTPLDLVVEWGPGTSKVGDALHWLAGVLGLTISKPDAKANRANVPAPAGGRSVAESAGGGGRGGDGDDAPAANEGDDEGDAEAYEATAAKLVKHRGRPMDCRENVMYCLKLDPKLKGLVRKNLFTHLLDCGPNAPWDRIGTEWIEDDDLMLGEYLLRTYGLSIKAKGTLRDGVVMAARQNGYNPVVDLIKAEKWDGVERLEHWLTDVYEVEERPYTRLIGKCFMMGLVKRAIQPGCKFDYMLIVKGGQGVQKTSTWRALAYPYYTDNAIKVGEKDSQLAQQLAWVVESGELESLSKADSTAIKQHLSSQEDWFRPPYGAQMVKAPRHSVHVGTTNADTFLRDATGDRRFWPLEVKAAHVDVIHNLRAQLLAEALVRVERGERYWPTREEERDIVFPEQEPFKRVDPWEDMLHEYVNSDFSPKVGVAAGKTRDFFPTSELYVALNIKADRIDGAGQMDTRISNAMKALHFERHRQTSGSRLRGYKRVPPPAEPGSRPPPPAPPQHDAPPPVPAGPAYVYEGDDAPLPL